MKPFTAIGALVFLIVAIAQAARAALGVDVVIDNNFHVPIVASWIAAAVAGLLAIMLFREARG